MTVPSNVAFARFLCRLYADGKVKPGTTFTYLAPASHRARANGDGPDDFGIGEASESSPQPSCLSDVSTSGVEPTSSPLCRPVGLPSAPGVYTP